MLETLLQRLRVVLHTRLEDLMTADSLEFQSVPVPSQHVAAVYRFLADLNSDLVVTDDEPTDTVDGEEDVWTDDMLTRVAGSDKKAVVILGKVLTALSQDPDAWYSLEQLEEPTGETRHQLRYIWSSLTRHFESKYGTRSWPVTYQWGTEFEPRRDPVMFYKVTNERADQWKRTSAN